MTNFWWEEGVIYQVYPRSFKDSDGDGVGDLRGLIDKLDYLAATLGIDAIWLSPFMKSPMADFGYDVSDYGDVDPIFGTFADYDRLITEAHARGLKIIIDFVPNHSSDQHAWFIESRSSRDNPKRDYYMWRDGKDGKPPNNWVSVFGGPAWTLDERTGQYYLHSFLESQPDLNWRNPELKRAMLDMLRMWLEHGTDGLRIDTAHFVMKDPDLRDDPPNPSIGTTNYKSFGEYDTLLHVYSKNHADNHPLYREIRALLNEFEAISPRVSVGETHILDWKDWASYYGAANDELHMPFNFGLLGIEWDANLIRASVDSQEAALPRGAWPNYVLSNHDEHRIPTRLGHARARVAMLLLLTLRGTPQIYYGDEIGMLDVEIPAERVQDPWGKRVVGLGLGRDPERTPMQWDASANAGFAPEGAQTWLPIAPDYATRNVAAQLEDPASMLNFTRGLLKLRREHAALNHGAYAPLSETPEGVFGYTREADDGSGERFLVLLNFTSEPRTVNDVNGKFILSTHSERGTADAAGSFALRGDEGVILQLV